MSVETQSSPEVALEAAFAKQLGEDKPIAEAPEPEDDDESAEDSAAESTEEDDESTDEPEAATEEPDDSEEVELDGEVFALPKKVRDAVMKQKDYTQKTQEVASIKKIYEDKAQYVEAREMILTAAAKESAVVESLQQQLKDYESVDWSAIIQADPQQAMRLNFAKQQLESNLQTARASLDQAIAQARTAQEKHNAKQQELGRAELSRRLGTISEKDRASMLSLATELGYEERDLMSVAAVNALALAAKYKGLQAAKPNIEKRVSNARPMVPSGARTNITVKADKTKVMQQTYRKTGKSSDVEAFLEARINAIRKR
jgi:hypothetical protein